MRLAVLPLFSRYVWVRTRLAKRAARGPEKLLLLITNRFSIHIVMLIIGMGVIITNINYRDLSEEYSTDALVYQVIGASDSDIIEDTTPISETPQLYSYIDPATRVTRQTINEIQGDDTDTDNNLPQTTSGGIALNKPDGMTPDNGGVSRTRSSVTEYTVRDGDSIGKIARDFNISVNTLVWANGISTSGYIKPGQRLVIPPTTGVLHTVAKGDTLAKIALKYDANESQISEFNGLAAEGLVAGRTIMIPGGRVIDTPKPRAIAATTPKVTARTQTSNIEPAAPAGSGKYVWPNGCRRVSQAFRGRLHTGIDIACPYGTQIRAAEAGVISKVQYGNSGYGNHIMINHGGGIVTLYGHLSTISVKAGQRVDRGELIGLEGSTGRSTGPHLHFEVRINGAFANPLNYVR
ncbi:MAG: M23 family metallopeptidase [Candidatus Buchananbacteria bacterium]|nr:M23 family metallopeptidase [Candidatus Buchananbacteria bacterium]